MGGGESRIGAPCVQTSLRSHSWRHVFWFYGRARELSGLQAESERACVNFDRRPTFVTQKKKGRDVSVKLLKSSGCGKSAVGVLNWAFTLALNSARPLQTLVSFRKLYVSLLFSRILTSPKWLLCQKIAPLSRRHCYKWSSPPSTTKSAPLQDEKTFNLEAMKCRTAPAGLGTDQGGLFVKK